MMDTSKEFLSFYKHPFLAADRIELRHGTDAIVLYQGKRELELTINGDIEGARATLQDLCDPNSDTWQRVRTEMQDGLAELLDKLDRLGWLCDADQGGHKKIADERERLSNLHTRTVQWLLTPVSTAAGIEESELNWRQRYQASAANFASEAKALWLARKQDQLTVTVQPAMFAEGNLAAEGLSLLLRAWQRTSPLALQLVASVFSSVSAQLSSYMSDELEPLDSLATTMSDAEEVSKQVWAAAVLLILSASANRNARYSAFIPEENLEGSGLSVLVRAEIAAEKLLSALGRSPLLRLLERGRPARRVAIAVYLHQYFTTIRYIEAVISFLRYRLREPLRITGLRYLLEEYGHEVHELEACRDLGVGQNELLTFAPLPFFVVYPEVLGLVAAIDPLAFCLSVTVAEGLPGARKPIVGALAAQGIAGPNLAAHQQIDIDLDHTLFTRRFLHTVPWVEADVARRSIKSFLFMLELSQLCWWQLASYSAREDIGVIPIMFELSAVTVRDLWSATV